uniref:hypothetical protein n=1 Tax=Streptomyces sp. SAT1 TaxID=1849967 RepID=UPI0007F9F283|nr:hypothetical protein [Streptomyces sp. SAT1]ANO42849.1 hypothetical protein A8713_037035 [Streptomyces sp. SAT1]
MNSDHDKVWGQCVRLGRLLLPLVDQEQWRQDRRRENLSAWSIDTGVGERLIEIFVALAAHAVTVDASVTAAGFDALTVSSVAEAAVSKPDFELLAGLPSTFVDDRDEHAVMVFRLYAYESDQSSLQLMRLSREVRHALVVLAERSQAPSPTCGDVFRRASEAGLAR